MQSCLLCFFRHPKAAHASVAAIPTPLQSALMLLPRAVHEVFLCSERSPKLQHYLVIAKSFISRGFLQCTFLLAGSFYRSCHQDCLLTHISHKLWLASSCGLMCIHSEILPLLPGAFWTCNAIRRLRYCSCWLALLMWSAVRKSINSLGSVLWAQIFTRVEYDFRWPFPELAIACIVRTYLSCI